MAPSNKAAVVALVPARAGSQRVVDKNLKRLGGVPLVGWAVMHARACKLVDEVYLSTDGERIAEMGSAYGACVPFLRPAELSGPESLDIDFFRHFIAWWQEGGRALPELIVQVRPTSPLRDSAEIDEAISLMLCRPDADSLRSVSPARESPYKMWRSQSDNRLEPAMVLADRPDSYDFRGQDLPSLWVQDGMVDIVRPRVVLEQNSVAGRVILGHFTRATVVDIDLPEDLARAEQALSQRGAPACQPLESRLGSLQGRLVPSEDGQLQCFPSTDWQREFEIAGQLGFAHIEWLLPRDIASNPLLLAAGQKQIEDLTARHDVRIATVCVDPLLNLPLWTPDAQWLIERIVPAAVRLGADGLVLPLLEANASDPRLRAALGEIVRSLDGTGLRVFAEITAPADAVSTLIDELDPETCLVCLDTGNLTRAQLDPMTWFDRLSARIGHIHLKSVDAQGRNVPFADGTVNIRNFVRHAEASGYRGRYTLEADRGANPVETARIHRRLVLSADCGVHQ